MSHLENIKNILRPVYKVFRPLYRPVMDRVRDPKRYSYLFYYIRQIKPQKILEIGTWHGDRAVQMIQKAQKYTKDPIEYYGLDLFEEMTGGILDQEMSKPSISIEKVGEKLSGLGAKTKLIKGDTTKLPQEMWEMLPQMDFIFIDGGHSLETIQSDWEHTRGLMHERTVVLFDDYWPNRTDAGAKQVVDTIDRTVYDVEVLPIIDHFKESWALSEDIQFAMVVLKSNKV